ncbi:MAG TPA: biopolymer transporter ExbD, partial [Hyphomicrobiales bacterium]|nr:biopolymer transporter ExbD [Hyphomicrobiales bacterium]
HAEVGIDLTSLIDVVFLLLLFFVVTTTFIRDSNLLINLPEAGGGVSNDEPLRIEVLVASDGSYSVNGQVLAQGNVQMLMQAVAAIAGGDTDLPVTITADAEATHQSVVTAMDAVAQLGIKRLNIATRRPDER